MVLSSPQRFVANFERWNMKPKFRFYHLLFQDWYWSYDGIDWYSESDRNPLEPK